MVGKDKKTTAQQKYNHIKSSNEKECRTGVRKCPPSTNPSGHYSALWTEEKEEKETYDVVLHNGDTVTKTYTPYRSKWKQRKDARRKNREEYLNKKQTEGVEFLNDNGIKIYEHGHFNHYPIWEPTETVEVEWKKSDYGAMRTAEGSYNYGYVAPVEVEA